MQLPFGKVVLQETQLAFSRFLLRWLSVVSSARPCLGCLRAPIYAGVTSDSRVGAVAMQHGDADKLSLRWNNNMDMTSTHELKQLPDHVLCAGA